MRAGGAASLGNPESTQDPANLGCSGRPLCLQGSCLLPSSRPCSLPLQGRCFKTSTYFHFSKPQVLGQGLGREDSFSPYPPSLPSNFSFWNPIFLHRTVKNLQTSLGILALLPAMKCRANHFTSLNFQILNQEATTSGSLQNQPGYKPCSVISQLCAARHVI